MVEENWKLNIKIKKQIAGVTRVALEPTRAAEVLAHWDAKTNKVSYLV